MRTRAAAVPQWNRLFMCKEKKKKNPAFTPPHCTHKSITLGAFKRKRKPFVQIEVLAYGRFHFECKTRANFKRVDPDCVSLFSAGVFVFFLFFSFFLYPRTCFYLLIFTLQPTRCVCFAKRFLTATKPRHKAGSEKGLKGVLERNVLTLSSESVTTRDRGRPSVCVC